MHYDIIITGGGFAGKSLALALGKAPLNLALVDASQQEQPDPRLIALNYGSIRFLTHLGLWPTLEPLSTPIHEVQVSHRGHFGGTCLSSEAIHLPTLGYVVRAQHLNEALDVALRTSIGQNRFTEWRPAKVKALALQEHNTSLTIE